MDIKVEIVFKRMKLGHIINNLHEKVRISVPLLTSELPQEYAYYKSVCGHWLYLIPFDLAIMIRWFVCELQLLNELA